MPVKLEQLTRQQFDRFCDFIYRTSGIRIAENKQTLLSNRIRRRLREGQDFEAYYQFLTSPAGDGEIGQFIDAITTNETFFFRTDTHFQWFGDAFLGELIEAAQRGRRPRSLRVWSAGCATGAEPYTLAICLRENLFRLRDWSLEIVGTDISDEALDAAREGWFRPRAVEAVNEKQRKRYFERSNEDDRWRVRDNLRDLVHFENHNLLEPMPRGPFDCVFIRNVLIYFDRESKAIVVEHLVNALAPGGYLVVGPSEGLYDMLEPLERISTFLYRKTDAS
ncbi:MAG: methyltransferase domain-containing protein [Planctomycetes bacterium]|nr:methyltransferase domain-containing protein [Planctomycetota bacterium]